MSATEAPQAQGGTDAATEAVAQGTDSGNGRLDAKPPYFNGSADDASHFLLRLQNYFEGNPTKYPGNYAGGRQRVLTAISFMNSGIARVWADDIIKDAVERGEKANTGADYPTWAQFKEQFKATFEDPNTKHKARDDIQRLQQGKHTVNEYISTFDTLRSNTNFDDEALVEMFKKGLRWGLLKPILELQNAPTTLDSWKRHARQFENIERIRIEEEKRHGGTAKPIYPNVGIPRKFEYRPQYVPMDVDAFNAGPSDADISRLSTEERAQHVREGKCFECHQKGHMARECPNKKTFKKKKTLWQKKKTTKYQVRATDGDDDDNDNEQLLYKVIKATDQLTPAERDVVKAALAPRPERDF